MEGVRHEGWWIWPYASMLYTSSPLLQEIYCESHRFEPWAVEGEPRRYGHYRFPGVVYVPAEERDRLLTSIGTHLLGGPEYARATIARFRQAARALLGVIRAARDNPPTAAAGDKLIDETGRILSSGIFKEALEPEAAQTLLAELIPVDALKEPLLALYQPLCLPHFVAFELRLLEAAARWLEQPTERVVESAIRRAAHLSRFLLEPAPLADPAAMRAELNATAHRFGHDASAIRRERARRLAGHHAAVRASFTAEQSILTGMDRTGRYSLRTKSTVAALVRFLQFVATFEELKHILAVEAAQVLRRMLAAANLPIVSTDRRTLIAALV